MPYKNVASDRIVVIAPINSQINQRDTVGMILVYMFNMENSGTSLKSRIEDLEKEEITRALKECGWVMARAAKRLGITERMIGYKIQKYGLRIKEVRWNEKAAEGQEDDNEQTGSH